MKKVLSVILALTLLFSSLTAVAFAADDATGSTGTGFDFDLSQLVSDKINEANFANSLENYVFDESSIPDEYKNEGKYDMEALVKNGTANDVYMFGLSLDFLYNSEEPFFWTKLPSSADPYCTSCKKAFDASTVTSNICPVCGKTLKTNSSYTSVTLALANLNLCLKNMLNNHYGDDKIYTNENATKICNIIGHLINPDYVDQNIGFPHGIAEDSSDEFYDTIAEKSGLKELLQLNWCDNYTLNIKPLLYTLGVNFNDFPVPDRDIHNGVLVSRILIRSIVKSLLENGPVNYILNVVWAFSRTYSVYLYEPVKALFKLKISKGMIDDEQLKTIKGLLNLIFNDNDSTDESKLQFITPPVRRFALAETKQELFLYVIVYLNLVGKNGSNPSVIESLKADINANTVLTDVEKGRLVTIVSGLFCGKLNEMVPMLANFLAETLPEVKDNLWKKFIKSIKNLINKFVSVIDRIFNNFKNIGNLGK